MKILITGAAGFIGSHLCDKYVKNSDTVLALDNFLSGSLDNIKHLLDYKNFKFIKGDVLDKELLEKIIPGCDAIFHLAAQVHVDRSYVEPELTWKINVLGTQNILELARFYDIKKVIHASSSEVYGSAQYVPQDEKHPLSAPHPYGASKIAADRLCYSYQRTYNQNIIIVRPFNIFGPRQRDLGYGGVISIFTRRCLHNTPPIVFGDGMQSREYTYVEDIVDGYDKILKYKEQILDAVNLGTGEEITISDLATKIIKLCGKSFKPVFSKPRMAEVDRLCADVTRAKMLFKWNPSITIDEGLKRFVEWYGVWGLCK